MQKKKSLQGLFKFKLQSAKRKIAGLAYLCFCVCCRGEPACVFSVRHTGRTLRDLLPHPSKKQLQLSEPSVSTEQIPAVKTKKPRRIFPATSIFFIFSFFTASHLCDARFHASCLLTTINK